MTSDSLVASLKVEPNGATILKVGYLKLEGKLMDLPKPILLTKKRKRDSDQMNLDENKNNNNNNAIENVSYDILGFARKKFLFKTRPKILVPSELVPTTQKTATKSSKLTDNNESSTSSSTPLILPSQKPASQQK